MYALGFLVVAGQGLFFRLEDNGVLPTLIINESDVEGGCVLDSASEVNCS